MNRKFLYGLSFCGIAGAFWACGSGDILKPTPDDSYMTAEVEGLTIGVKTNIITKENCPLCFTDAPESSAAVKPASSVSTLQSSSTVLPPNPFVSSSSSSDDPIIIVSSSSVNPFPLTESSSSTENPLPIASSSSAGEIITPTPGGVGTCAPSPATVNRGDKVTWSFTKASTVTATAVMNSTFEWKMPDGNPASFEASGMGGLRVTATYATSGKHTATVTMKSEAGQNLVSCTPVQVNGAPITGCKCAASNAKLNLKGESIIDVVSAQSVEFAVTGCASTGANITTYTWTGATGSGAAASAAVAAKGDAVQPKVMVANDDNSEIEVACPLVTAIDSRIPDFELTGMTDKNGITFKPEGGKVAATITMNLEKDPNNQARKFACKVERGGSGDGRISGTVGSVKMAGGDYVASDALKAEETVGGYQLEILLDVGQNESVLCFVTN